MYKLALHIEYLLLHHDCVVLPGIGAFINVRHSAFYDEETQQWIPMTREVRFNSALKHDDGLLATSYARKDGLEFNQAREILREDLNRLKSSLKEDGEVTIGNIGILSQKEESINFRPIYLAQQWSNMIGYGNVSLINTNLTASEKTTISRAEQEDAGSSHQDNDSTIIESAEQTTPNTKLGTKTFDTEKNYYIKVNKIAARAVASLFIVVTILLSTLLPGSNREKIDKASLVPFENILLERLQAMQSGFEQSDDTTNSAIEEETETAQGDVKEEGEKPTACYYAIVGTFMTLSEAETYLSHTQNESYPLMIVSTPTRARVAALKSEDKESLQLKMQNADFQQRFPQSWIWRGEKTQKD